MIIMIIYFLPNVNYKDWNEQHQEQIGHVHKTSHSPGYDILI